MSKQKAVYDSKGMFLRGLMAFGRAIGAMVNPMAVSGPEQIHYTREQQIRRARSHAQFKAQRLARREQRRRAR